MTFFLTYDHFIDYLYAHTDQPALDSRFFYHYATFEYPFRNFLTPLILHPFSLWGAHTYSFLIGIIPFILLPGLFYLMYDRLDLAFISIFISFPYLVIWNNSQLVVSFIFVLAMILEKRNSLLYYIVLTLLAFVHSHGWLLSLAALMIRHAPIHGIEKLRGYISWIVLCAMLLMPVAGTFLIGGFSTFIQLHTTSVLSIGWWFFFTIPLTFIYVRGKAADVRHMIFLICLIIGGILVAHFYTPGGCFDVIQRIGSFFELVVLFMMAKDGVYFPSNKKSERVLFFMIIFSAIYFSLSIKSFLQW